MTSIERTAYPRFKRLITARELHLFFSPSREEVGWAVARTDPDGHQLALLVLLKSYQRMGCFPRWEEVPETVVDFVRRAVELPEGVVAGYSAHGCRRCTASRSPPTATGRPNCSAPGSGPGSTR
ncbi:DUF4158 domain-containing protein, partial [Kitasatospora sp. NPDC047058]|uniref:DUF4158 domain-containing protein n=1 Tax=Kitasatospora sp. NPDC047058 TaxID=3155620 RepID=UPI0033C508CA